LHLRKFQLDDYEVVVDMLYNFYIEVYGDMRKIGSKYFFYKEVAEWINSGKDIVIAEQDCDIAGFTLAYINDFGGMTEPVYYGEIAFVYPEYRKGRAAYMLYKNVVQYAQEIGLNLFSNGRVENKVSDMIEKHFNPKKMFINYERTKHGK
jgi:GNAT superfamily N-acetyltransferase